MNVNELIMSLQTDDAGEIPRVGEKREWLFFGELVPFVVTKVSASRSWVTGVVEGEGSWSYSAAITLEWDADAEEDEEPEGDPVEKVIAESRRGARKAEK